MKALIVFTLLHSACVNPASATEINAPPGLSFERILEALEIEINRIQTSYLPEYKTLQIGIAQVRSEMQYAQSTEQLVKLIYRKDHLLELLDITKQSEYADISKVRYLKGLQLIRLLYEKMLALDHHFEAVTTLGEMSAMANPNTYPVFNELKGILKQENKKASFELPSLLGDNIYTSIVHSVVSLFNSNQTKKEKEERKAATRKPVVGGGRDTATTGGKEKGRWQKSFRWTDAEKEGRLWKDSEAR